MEYVEPADPRPEPISIARCRELLGEDAFALSWADGENLALEELADTAVRVD